MRVVRIGCCVFAIALLLTGCGARSAPPVTTPGGTPPLRVPAAEAALKIRIDTGASRYRIESRTFVFAAADTTLALDSLVISATATVRASKLAGGLVAMHGTVDRLTVTSGAGAARTSQSLQMPYSLEWTVTADSIRTPPRQMQSGCDQIEETARDVLISIFPTLPDSVARGQTWQSNSRVESCRSGIMISVAQSNTLQAADYDLAMRNQRLSLVGNGEITANGMGNQGGANIVLRGTGSTGWTYVVDLGAGVVQSTTTRTTINLEFDLGYRTDRLVQRTVRSTTRLQ